MYGKLCDLDLNKDDFDRYKECKEILGEINKYKKQGSYIRSRLEFIEKMEKSNSYFYNEERETYSKKFKRGLHYSCQLYCECLRET